MSGSVYFHNKYICDFVKGIHVFTGVCLSTGRGVCIGGGGLHLGEVYIKRGLSASRGSYLHLGGSDPFLGPF